jgi:hypothetical protein
MSNKVAAPRDFGVYKEEIINELGHAAITAFISPQANS